VFERWPPPHRSTAHGPSLLGRAVAILGPSPNWGRGVAGGAGLDPRLVGGGAGYGLGVTIVIGVVILIATVLALGLCIVCGVALWMVAMSREKLTFRKAFAMLLNREKPSAP
jgi:hypothetical protein